MPDTDGHHAAALYLVAGVRGALSKIRHDPGVFTAVADAMERSAAHLDVDDRAALQTATRWLRHLGAAGPDGRASVRPRD